MKGQTLTYIIAPEHAGHTIKSFLRNTQAISRKLLVKMKQDKTIFLNGRFTYLDHPLSEGDVITMVMGEEESENIVPQEMPLSIVYEDEDLMVVNKPSDMCVHPTLLHPDGTLANGIAAYWKKQGFSRKFRAVNRLDKNTTGLLIIAKNKFAHQQLAVSQRNHLLHRNYEALVHGVLVEEEGSVDAPIGRRSISLVEREVREDGQEAITHYNVSERFRDTSYVRLTLETGRTHQIRVHMSYIGHPLLGDDLYGGSRELISRQALHAGRLSFPHPRTGENMVFEVQAPADMRGLLDRFRKEKEEV